MSSAHKRGVRELRFAREVQKRQAIAADADETRGLLDSVRGQMVEQRGMAPQLALRSCKLAASQIEAIDSELQSGRWAHSRVAALRAAAKASPEPPKDLLAAMSDIQVGTVAPAAQRPPWIGVVAHNRDSFARTAWMFRVAAGGEIIMKLLFAMQNPLVLRFSRMTISEYYWRPEHIDGQTWGTWGLKCPTAHEFVADFATSMGVDQLPTLQIEGMACRGFGWPQEGGGAAAMRSAATEWRRLAE